MAKDISQTVNYKVINFPRAINLEETEGLIDYVNKEVGSNPFITYDLRKRESYAGPVSMKSLVSLSGVYTNSNNEKVFFSGKVDSLSHELTKLEIPQERSWTDLEEESKDIWNNMRSAVKNYFSERTESE